MNKPWLEVDIKGFGQMMRAKKKTFVINELAQDAFDENITCCKVGIHWNNGKVQIAVEDDSPEGFKNIEHAYTLFADTYKRRDPTKRGRYNMGDKNVLAICINYGAEISTTTGTIEFHPKKGRIHHWSKKRERGSVFKGTFRATKDEYQELLDHAKKLLPPQSITYIVNDKIVHSKPVFKTFPCTLETVILENDVMKTLKRKTTVNLIKSDGQSYIYEMGIPIMETDCCWHIDVQQKIPLTIDRESVKPSYLQNIYAEVLNQTYDDIENDEVSAGWVRIGFSNSKRINKNAVEGVKKKRYGDKILVRTPNDPIANDDAIAHGFHIVSGSEFSAEEWESIKKHSPIKSTHDKFGKNYEFGDYECIEPTEKQQVMIDFIKKIARDFLGIDNLVVELVEQKIIGNDLADYSTGIFGNTLRIASKSTGISKLTERNLDLIIHELCHHYGHHTEKAYLNKITSLGAQLTFKALYEPSYFDEVIEDNKRENNRML
jgi:hypothetical protein